jgi:hypothetical protein
LESVPDPFGSSENETGTQLEDREKGWSAPHFLVQP